MPEAPQRPQQYTSADSSSLAPPPDPIAPLRVALRAHYEFERELGQGAFATVYLARDLKHERKVAIKVLHADPNSELGELRFVREIRMLARLQHPNILPLHDSGHVETLLYYVMPYVSGETLRDRLRAEGQLPWEMSCNIARDVADALSYAHGQGIIHRDIKPENILLSAGHPMLADFGIARAIDVAGVRHLTRTGMGSPGTPAYMSPEQLLGISEVDARSDIYSLGCVLFEMLTGVLPFPGDEGLVNRFTDAMPSVASHAQDLPNWVDAALRKALEREPKARYATATDFASALCEPSVAARSSPTRSVSSAAVGGPASAVAQRKGRLGTWVGKLVLREWNSRTFWLFAALIAVGAVVVPPTISRLGARDRVDPTRFVILSVPSLEDTRRSFAPRASQQLYDALSSWKGLPLVSDAAVEETARADRAPRTLRDAFRVAQQLGAGNVIWVREASGPAGGVKAELFDVINRTSTGRFVFLNDSSSAGDYARAALNLAGMSNRARLADGGDDLTASFEAWGAYNRGHVALAKWDLGEASRQFDRALAYDANFSPAQTWLAQIRSWTDPPDLSDWAALARRAVSAGRLHDRDRLIAQALVALGDQRLDEACTLYRRLSSTNDAAFLSAYGLGECQALDSLVIRSAGRGTGWRFRSSYQAAANAYMRALNVEPRAHSIFPFARLQRLLPTSATRVRVGRGPTPRVETFLAYPALDPTGDTVGFTPYPLRDFASLSPAALATQNAALERNAETLAAFTSEWTRQLPSDPEAFAARAEVLEIKGDIAGEPFDETSVMKALRQVRALSKDPQTIFEARVKEAWLRFKREEFGAARSLADSLLRARPNPNPAEAEALLPLAAVTGKLDRAVALGRSVYPLLPVAPDSLPVRVWEAASDLLVNSALGVCGERISALEQQLQQALVRYVPKERAAVLRDELMARPLSLTVPCTNGQSALRIAEPRMRLYQIQRAFAQSNMSMTRALLDSASKVAGSGRPGDKSVDFTYQEAWIQAAIGDTAIAMQLLDNVLGALPSLSPDNVQALGSASALGQAMVLRSRLAAARGDLRTAQRWGRAASQLWATADPIVRQAGKDVWAFAN